MEERILTETKYAKIKRYLSRKEIYPKDLVAMFPDDLELIDHDDESYWD